MRFLYPFFVTICIVFVFSACSSRGVDISDKYVKSNRETNITTVSLAIKEGDLELADQLYLKSRGDHVSSNKLSAMILDLAKAHIQQHEYLIARYYAEAYITEYPSGVRIDQAWYLRAKSLFLRYKKYNFSFGDTDRLNVELNAFLDTFPKSKYASDIKYMQKQMVEMLINRNKDNNATK